MAGRSALSLFRGKTTPVNGKSLFIWLWLIGLIIFNIGFLEKESLRNDIYLSFIDTAKGNGVVTNCTFNNKATSVASRFSGRMGSSGGGSFGNEPIYDVTVQIKSGEKEYRATFPVSEKLPVGSNLTLEFDPKDPNCMRLVDFPNSYLKTFYLTMAGMLALGVIIIIQTIRRRRQLKETTQAVTMNNSEEKAKILEQNGTEKAIVDE